jgi:hypothetical protein
MCAIATKLRLTPQSSRDSRHTKLVPPGPYPWENRDGDEAEPPLVPDDGSNERNFNFLLQQQRARRGFPAHATLAATEAADAASFLGKSDEEAPNAA